VELIAIAVEGHEDMFTREGFLYRADDVPLHMADCQVDKSDIPAAGQLIQQERLWDAALLDKRMNEGSSEPLGERAGPVEVRSIDHSELFYQKRLQFLVADLQL